MKNRKSLIQREKSLFRNYHLQNHDNQLHNPPKSLLSLPSITSLSMRFARCKCHQAKEKIQIHIPASNTSNCQLPFIYQMSFQETITSIQDFVLPFTKPPFTLASKGNSTLFAASQNILQETSISKSHSQSLIRSQPDLPQFNIHELLLNHSESLIALIGQSRINVIDSKSQNQDFVISQSALSFALGPFDSDIVSVKWHPACPRNSSIAILTKSGRLYLYDLIISSTVPIIHVDLKPPSPPTSMSFLSNTHLTGSLCLYISLENGDVCPVFPFLSSCASIKTSKRQVDRFVDETQAVINDLDKNFPPVALVKNSTVDRVYDQLKLALSLQAKAHSPVNSNASPNDTIVLDSVVHDFKVQLQPPTQNFGVGARLIPFGDNAELPLFCVIREAPSERVIHLSVHAQLHLLVMGWSGASDLVPPQEPKKPASQPQRDPSYTKPKKGFGYAVVSDDDDDDDDSGYEAALQEYKDEVSIFDIKKKCGEWISPKKAKSTKIVGYRLNSPESSGYMVKGVHDDGIIIVAFSKIVVVVDATKWVSEMARDFTKTFVKFYATNQRISLDHTIEDYTLIEDDISGSGKHLIIRNREGKLYSKNIDNAVGGKKDTPLAKKAPIAEELKAENVGIPADGLKQVLTSGNESPPALRSIQLDNVEDLSELHKHSAWVTKRVLSLTLFMAQLQLKLKLQQERLLQQQDAYTNNKSVAVGEFESYGKRINELEERQQTIIKRGEELKSKLLSQYEQTRKKKQLPLSDAEKQWFKELNCIRQRMANDREGKRSLAAEVSDLQKQVKAIVEQNELKTSTTEDVTASMRDLHISSEIPRLHHFLSQETKLILAAKARLEESVKNVDKLIEV